MDHKIICWHSGYKGQEFPLIFYFEDQEMKTEELVEERLIEDCGTRERIRAFLVRTGDGQFFDIMVGSVVQIKRRIPPSQFSSD